MKVTSIAVPTDGYRSSLPPTPSQCLLVPGGHTPLMSQSWMVPLASPAASSAPSSPYAQAVTATRPGRSTLGFTTVRWPTVAVSHMRSVPSSPAVSAVCLPPGRDPAGLTPNSYVRCRLYRERAPTGP